jgi:hypothetical protein
MDDATRRRLAELRSECGCNAGAAAFLLSVGAFVTYSVWLDPVARSLGERVVIGVGVGLVAMLIGKVLGMSWARYQARQLLRGIGQRSSAADGSGLRREAQNAHHGQYEQGTE